MPQAVSYWDLSEKERSELSREDVQKFVDFELMQKGVLKVEPPQLEPVGEPTVQPRTYFGVEAQVSSWDYARVLFATREQAEAFLQLEPCAKRSDYLEGSSIEYAVPFAATVKTIEVLTEQDFQTHRSALQSAEAAKATNKKRQEEYEKAVKAQDDALKGLWDDWSECRNKAYELGKVRTTWEQYCLMAGDSRMALKFLHKVFTAERIEEANAWFGLGMPIEKAVPAEPMPQPEAQ